MTIMYPNYENYEQYPKYEQHDHDQNDWGFFINLDDLYDDQLSQNNKYIDNYKKQQKRINYMSSIKEIDRNVDIDMVDDDEFGWYVPDKRPNKHEQIDMDIRTTAKRTKINFNIEYDYDMGCNGVIAQQRERCVVADPEYFTSVPYSDNNAFMKSCLNTCIVLGISIGCSIFIVLF
uniref:Uncharacterized protein n=1 Tax=viral metagenome TaxID=1070528 RepID=A0A6C0EVN9_9ZZZZ